MVTKWKRNGNDRKCNGNSMEMALEWIGNGNGKGNGMQTEWKRNRNGMEMELKWSENGMEIKLK
jgi:hypothetical protein